MFSLVNRCSSIWIVFCMAHTVQICSIWRITGLLILNMCTDSHGIVMIGESLMLGSHSGLCYQPSRVYLIINVITL